MSNVTMRNNAYLKTTIAIIIALIFAISLVALPATNAHTPPYQIQTYAKITVLPNPIGVGQSALGYAFLGNPPPSGSTIINTYRFHNYTVIITDPNGEVTTMHWDTVQDTTGAQMFRFTPTVAGVYNITFNYGGQVQRYPQDTGSTSNDGDVYLPSTGTCTLTVQEDPVPNFPSSYPLPTEYWIRPIYGENPGWWSISSDWLGVGSPVMSSVSSGTITAIGSSSMIQRFPGDAVGPLTSHVMWTKPIQEGGVVGGNRYETQGDTYFEGSAYQQRFRNPIIVYGRLFYQEPVSFLGPSSGDSVCVDLRTGQEIWRRNDFPTISFAYIPNIQNPNQHGVFPALLCTSNFGQCYDMYTGRNVFNVSSIPSGGTLVMGPQGEHIRYYFVNNGTSSNPNWFLAQWNSTKFFRGTGYHPGESGNSPTIDTQTTSTTTNVTSTTYINGVLTTTRTPVTTTTTFVNGSRGNRYDWLDPTTQNMSIPWRNQLPSSFSFTVLAAHYGNIMICRNGSYPSLTGATHNASGNINLNSANWTYFAINLNASKGPVGSILWWSPTYTEKVDKTITYGGADPVARVFIEAVKETQNIIGYSYANGAKLWETNVANELRQQEIAVLDYFGNPYYPYVATQCAYGNVYSISYGGILFCYDLQTGKRLWSYGNGNTAGNSTDSFLQMPGPYPAFINAVGDGVIYTVSTQHTVITPIPKGNMARAINATDGTEIWTLSAYTGEFSAMSYAMADGYSVLHNGYDNQIYSVGKGPSVTTVSAPDLSAAFGQPVVIRGTVFDVSAGTKQNAQAARFANGVPVASDASMTEWMGYIYQQKPLPSNFTGVEVTINVLDSNGNFRPIGTVMTDATGAYNLVWEPDIPGEYTVVATFAGTDGYWPSSATTAFNVMGEAQPTAAPTAAPVSMADMYFLPLSIGMIVAIIVIGAIVILILLRKRP